MLIVNKTDLSYEEIGKLLDDIVKQNKGKEFDKNIGKYQKDIDNIIQVDIYYLKKYTKIVVWEKNKEVK